MSVESSLLHPYEFVRESDTDYTFTTDEGIVYRAYFIDYSDQFPALEHIYSFNIEPEETRAIHPIDIRIAHTVVSILTKFFQSNENAMLMVCDSTDGKEYKRKLLFERWYQHYKSGDIVKYDASLDTGDYMLYVSLFLRSTNPNYRQIVYSFYNLVSNNMCPE